MICSLCSFNEGLVCFSSLKMLYAPSITHVLFGSSFHSHRHPTWFWGSHPTSSSTPSVENVDNCISLPDLFWTGCFLVQVCYLKPGFITHLCLLSMSLGAETGIQPPPLPGWARGDVTKGGSRHSLSHSCAQAACQQLQPGHSQVSSLALGYIKHQLRTA